MRAMPFSGAIEAPPDADAASGGVRTLRRGARPFFERSNWPSDRMSPTARTKAARRRNRRAINGRPTAVARHQQSVLWPRPQHPARSAQ